PTWKPATRRSGAKLSKGSQLKKIASVSNQKSLQKLPSCAVEFTRSGFPITAGLTTRARRLTGRMVCGLCTASSNTIYFDDRCSLTGTTFSNLSYCRRSWAADVAAAFDESGDELSATGVIEVNVTFGPYRRIPWVGQPSCVNAVSIFLTCAEVKFPRGQVTGISRPTARGEMGSILERRQELRSRRCHRTRPPPV